MQATMAAAAHDETALWRATLSGVCANLVGIGLARFAYTPLIPALILAGWFSPTQAAYLGAANLAGYLAGALLARPLGVAYGAGDLAARRHAAHRGVVSGLGLSAVVCLVLRLAVCRRIWRRRADGGGGARHSAARAGAPTRRRQRGDVRGRRARYRRVRHARRALAAFGLARHGTCSASSPCC